MEKCKKPEEKEILWRPQKKQAAFQRRREYEALYGGAAGGGKSDALLTEALRQVHIPHYRGLLLRKTYPELTGLIDRSRQIYSAAYPDAKYQEAQHVWRFPSGAKIYFGNMGKSGGWTVYQGKSFDFIGFDELTHFTFAEYSYLFSRNRPSGPGTRVYVRAATNPGGIGHGWVKERFISPGPAMTPIKSEMTVQAPDGKNVTLSRSRIFVPSTVFDNKALLDYDPNYLASLSLLPEAEKQALLYGSWDSFQGQVFTEWRNDSDHYRDQMHTHVIEPFPIPGHWRMYRGLDWGYSRPFSVGWFAVDEEGRIYHIKEYYGCTGVPNEGLHMDPGQVAAEIRRMEREDEQLKGRVITGIADPSIFDESRGQSIARMMEQAPFCVYFSPGDNKRLPGKMQFHYRLRMAGDGRPLFQVFRTCRNFIRTFPALQYDPARVEDIDSGLEDHCYDMARYVLMENPISPKAPAPENIPREDPLELCKPHQFYRI